MASPVYPDDEIRLAVQRAIAVEGSRGWKIAKEKTSHKIDIVVALAQAALAAVQNGEKGRMQQGAISIMASSTGEVSKGRPCAS